MRSNKITRLLDRVARRMSHARPGSIMIMVVSLLVLLALIGTALIVTSRSDRLSSQQHVANTQIDLLFEGAINMTKGAIASGAYGHLAADPATDHFRPASDVVNQYSYASWDAYLADPQRPNTLPPVDGWLAARIPERIGGNIVWPAITAPLSGNSFATPDNKFVALSPNGAERLNVQPDVIVIGGKSYPAFRIGGQLLLAADADGDGIADSGLWPMPVGQISGVTYYAAVRIIDNNSAYNLSSAWRPNAVPALPVNLFPCNINLRGVTGGIVANDAELDNLNRWRFNSSNNPPVPSLAPIRDNGSAGGFAFMSPYDAFWHQLVRRIENPGFNTPPARYQSISPGDMMSLVSGFVLSNPSGPASDVERRMPQTLVGGRSAPYAPGDTAAWFNQNFDYSGFPNGTYNRRPLVVTRNPVSNHIAAVSTGGPDALTPVIPEPDVMAPYGDPNCKINPNTGTFAELMRAYWSVMCETPTLTPYGPATNLNNYITSTNNSNFQRMFRSPLRDIRQSDSAAMPANTVHLPPSSVMLLRAALASINTIDLRSSTRDVTSAHLFLPAMIDGAQQNVDVVVYGYQPQPFITEVFVQNDMAKPFPKGDGTANDQPNPRGYVAVELYNPYDFDIPVINWRLGLIDRRKPTDTPAPASPYPQMQMQSLQAGNNDNTPEIPATSIPAHGYLVLENYTANPGASDGGFYARGRPPLAAATLNGNPANCRTVYVRDLHRVLNDAGNTENGGELVILRPHRADGQRLANAHLGRTWNYNEAQRIDDMVPVDQFDFTTMVLAGPPFSIYHYVRANDDANAWKMVYPGRYDGTTTAIRHEGVTTDTYNPMDAEPVPTTDVALGQADATASYTNTFLPIQLRNSDWAGPGGVAGVKVYPFGGFARNGDMFQVPFIGSYIIRTVAAGNGPGNRIYEINAVSMDSSFADDTDPADNNVENVGRFCPVVVDNGPNDYAGGPPAYAFDNAGHAPQHYRWATKLFDYFSVFTPHDDFLPNVFALQYNGPAPEPVDNNGTADPKSAVQANGADELGYGVEGLININTAPLPVFAGLPMVLAPSGEIDMAANLQLAQAIINDRNMNGPFRNIMELNRVPGFRTCGGALASPINPNGFWGDMTPANDTVSGDFEYQFAMFNRISNLITTRSDTFTCYVMVQGWRNAGSANPELVVQRRAAILVDRNPMSAGNRTLKTTYIPAR